MTKNDLQTGMVVETRAGAKYTLMKDAYTSYGTESVFVNHDGGGFTRFSEYNANLTSIYPHDDYDIMKVYTKSAPHNLLNTIDGCLDLIWEREHTPKVGDVYTNDDTKCVITYIERYGDIRILWTDGSNGVRTPSDIKRCFKFTGKNIASDVDKLRKALMEI